MKYELKTERAITRCLKVMENTARRVGDALTSPTLAAPLFAALIGREEREVFCVAFLNNAHQLIAAENMFLGTIDGASVYPREVLKRALQLNAAAVMFAHNHPSGEVEASRADKQITKRLVEALALIDVRVLDHFIVNDRGGYYSFKEKGDL